MSHRLWPQQVVSLKRQEGDDPTVRTVPEPGGERTSSVILKSFQKEGRYENAEDVCHSA